MTSIAALPSIMVAPNGARRTKHDHRALPITIEETVETAIACAEAGADGLHLHIRDKQGKHSLDPGIYSEALKEIENTNLDLQVQITTEAVGRYSPAEQRDVVRKLMPKAVSISVAEMLSEGEQKAARDFYAWCFEAGISVQHILYNMADITTLEDLSLGQDYPYQLLFVLGRYTKNQQSQPKDLDPFSDWVMGKQSNIEWGICAFGSGETDCLVHAHKLGGKVRVGFENSFWNRDGSIAKDNAERVREVISLFDR